ncbi:family 78 glycoside hydrolase catalytic domain [Kineococcus sp. SYSU DK018]|uniref:family 78 glycoside hydrolase catalytic domain n=1 Tax=Kineococcus sp. SYSU DK018 TaxID=3383139 RepID=UPI003D7D05C4
MSAVPARPTFEHHREALGIGEAAPRISWRTAAPAGWVPAGHELEVTRNGTVASTGRVSSPDSVLLAWPWEPLRSRETASVRVRVWGEGEREPSPWSEPATVETGLLRPEEWTALAVGPAWEEDPDSDRRPPLLRREFPLDRPVRSARLHATAHGVFRLEVNGQRVGTDELAPGWTVYGERLRCSTYDVTDLLRTGPNAIGSWLADGWYRGRLGFHGGHRNLYGTDLALVAQLHVVFEDGTEEVVATDEEWRAGFGPILFTGLYEGERHDARELPRGWSEPGFDDAAWSPVRTAPVDATRFVTPQGPPIRCTEELLPVSVEAGGDGRFLLDFGQNAAGRLRIRVRGEAGRTVTLTHAEVLQDGELCTRPLRGAESRDTFTLAGGGVEEWEPAFTIHGFRYAQVEGWPAATIEPGDVVFRVLHSDLERTGEFSCSDPMVERLHENVVWSMRSNFVDIPTDCPQRDERLGWTGDIQVFAPTAAFLYDCSGFLASWLRDVEAEQLEDGTVPWYVPVIPGDFWTPPKPGAVWGDVAVLTPWVLFERTGDAGVLAAQYDSARRWVDLVERLAGPERLWNSGVQLGDWLDPAAPPESPADARTDRYLVATAYFAWSARHLAETARVLGRDADARRYAALADEVRDAFLAEHLREDGRLSSDAQTAYALAIRFGLLTGEQQRVAGARLAELVREAGGRIATGFAGTPVICDALTQTGHLEEAYLLLLERGCPSWLYPVGMGATTIWERWDSMLPDGTVNPGEMTSFNHYALGAVADWLHRVVAGLAPDEPGYRSILFHPRPGGGLTSAAARHLTPYGTASIEWTLQEGGFAVTVQVPTGATGRLVLPDGATEEVPAGTHRFTCGARAADPVG